MMGRLNGSRGCCPIWFWLRRGRTRRSSRVARLFGVLDLSWVHPELAPTTRSSVTVDRSGTEIRMLILGYEFTI